MSRLMQTAIIKKDITGITGNKRLLSILCIVPLIMSVVLPMIFIFAIQMAPPEQTGNIVRLVNDARTGIPSVNESLNQNFAGAIPEQFRLTAIRFILNYIMPLFFLLIPIMSSSVMAASAFVGEKEKNTLETLLYCPLPLKEIFGAKILASFLLSMAISVASFIVMLVVLETVLIIISGTAVMPGLSWLIIMLLVSPSLALLAINLIVRGSAKSASIEESQQRAVFLVLPVVLLIVGQFTGVMLLSVWLLFAIGAVLAIIAVFMFKGSFSKFQYETLLL
ncbi:MAG: ABC transporter permease subunit [Treponema sp.]|nr:ABC transporter permease subunit [Treponema sp.]